MTSSNYRYKCYILVLLSVVLVACQSTESQSPTTIANDSVESVESDSSKNIAPISQTESILEVTSFSSQRGGYTLAIPTEWLALDMTSADVVSILLSNGDENKYAPELKQILQDFLDIDGSESVELIGILRGDLDGSTEDMNTTFNIATSPTYGLSLESYLETTAHQYDQLPDVDLEESRIVDELHSDYVPVAISKAIADGALYNRPDTRIVLYQAALYDRHAENMILLSFAADSQRFAEVQPTFEQLIQAITFDEE